MKLVFIGIALLCLSVIGKKNVSEEFEGQIDYKVEFELKNKRVDKNVLKNIFGVKKNYLYKNGRYKWLTKDRTEEFELFNYDLDSLNVISKKSNNDTLFYRDFTNSKDSLLSIERLNTMKICGLECLGVQFNMTDEKKRKITRTLYFPLDELQYPKSYYHRQKNMCNNFVHQYGGSIPLRLELDMEDAPFKMIYTATRIDYKVLDDKEFTINEKSPKKHR